MKKERYDLVFGFGATCGCSLTLRRAGLQLLSFPGDWTAPVWHDETHPRLQHDLRQRVDYFCGDKEVFFRPDVGNCMRDVESSTESFFLIEVYEDDFVCLTSEHKCVAYGLTDVSGSDNNDFVKNRTHNQNTPL